MFQEKTLMFLTLWQWFAKLGVTRIISGFDLGSMYLVVTITVWVRCIIKCWWKKRYIIKEGSAAKKPDKLPALSQISKTPFHSCVVHLGEGSPCERVLVGHSLQ